MFEDSKREILNFANQKLAQNTLSEEDRFAINILISTIGEYNYENRLRKKGLISRVIVDSLNLSYSIGEVFIHFDENIN